MRDFYGANINAILEVNALLRLPASGNEQDWEFEFADVEKMPEIMYFLNEKNVLSKDGVDAMALLFVASLEVAEEKKSQNIELIDVAKKWFSNNKNVSEKMFFYWVEMKRSFYPEIVKNLLGLSGSS